MAARPLPAAESETREQRIERLMKELRPKVEATVRQLVERAVDVPEAQEFGAIDFEFRDAGQKLANEVRQASVTSRKKTTLANSAGGYGILRTFQTPSCAEIRENPQISHFLKPSLPP
jgi:hypothetical protein